MDIVEESCFFWLLIRGTEELPKTLIFEYLNLKKLHDVSNLE